MASNREEFRALAPLVVATLRALNTFSDDAFRIHLAVRSVTRDQLMHLRKSMQIAHECATQAGVAVQCSCCLMNVCALPVFAPTDFDVNFGPAGGIEAVLSNVLFCMLQEFFPLLTELIGCEHAPPEVQVRRESASKTHSLPTFHLAPRSISVCTAFLVAWPSRMQLLQLAPDILPLVSAGDALEAVQHAHGAAAAGAGRRRFLKALPRCRPRVDRCAGLLRQQWRRKSSISAFFRSGPLDKFVGRNPA